MTQASPQRAGRRLRRLGRRVAETDLDQDWSGLDGVAADKAESVVLASYGLGADGRPTAAFTPDRGPWRRLGHLLGQVRAAVVFVSVAAVAGIVPGLAVPLLMKIFVDRFMAAGDESWAWPVLVGLVGSALVTAAVVALQYEVLRLAVLRLSKTGQVHMAWHMLYMRPPDLARFGAGDLAARANAQQRLAYQGGFLIPLAIVNVLNASVFTVALLLLNVPIGLAAIAVAVLSVLVSLLILRRRRSLQTDSDAQMLELSDITASTVASIESIKAAAWEQHAFTHWATQSIRTGRSLSRLGIANQWIVLVPATATALGLGAVLAVGAAQVFQGRILLGTVVAAQAFAVLLLEALAQLVFFGVLFQSVTSAGRQVDEVARTPLDPEVVELSEPESALQLSGALSLRAVTFGYDRAGPPLLDRLDLEIPAGSRLALVGSSGSGKTTIARLAIGELRPWSGRVELDGVPRLLVPRSARTRDVAYVPQQSVLFPGTLRDNLTMWDDSLTDDQLRAAARDARIESAILARAGGYYATVRGGDSGFSGGELQRLAIARALVRNPRLLVLDEATSALDPVVEAEVEQNLRRRGCTCLVVAHRLSTVRDADQIMVIHSGRVVQHGRFDDLRAGGHFAELIHG